MQTWSTWWRARAPSRAGWIPQTPTAPRSARTTTASSRCVYVCSFVRVRGVGAQAVAVPVVLVQVRHERQRGVHQPRHIAVRAVAAPPIGAHVEGVCVPRWGAKAPPLPGATVVDVQRERERLEYRHRMGPARRRYDTELTGSDPSFECGRITGSSPGYERSSVKPQEHVCCSLSSEVGWGRESGRWARLEQRSASLGEGGCVAVLSSWVLSFRCCGDSGPLALCVIIGPVRCLRCTNEPRLSSARMHLSPSNPPPSAHRCGKLRVRAGHSSMDTAEEGETLREVPRIDRPSDTRVQTPNI